MAKPVHQIKLKKNMTTTELVDEFSKCNVMGSGRVARAAEILRQMTNDKECNLFFGLAGAMVPGGLKEVIIDILPSVRAFVTTGATLTHDLVEALGFSHLQGSPTEKDEKLHKEGFYRMWDSYMSNKVYEPIEDFLVEHWDKFPKAPLSSKEILWTIGSLLPKKVPSILRTCAERKIPVYCPGFVDSGLGLMFWGRIASGKRFVYDPFKDVDELVKMCWDSKKSGVLYVGGGVPKNFIQQSLQFSKGASYGVQVTTDMPHWGGSSGAELREGISWGKMHPKANFVDVYADATIVLPLIWSAVKR